MRSPWPASGTDVAVAGERFRGGTRRARRPKRRSAKDARAIHHPGLTGARCVVRPADDRHDRAVRAVRRVHRRRDRRRHAGRFGASSRSRCWSGSRSRCCRSPSSTASSTALLVGDGAAAAPPPRADAADRSRDPQLAAREERLPRHRTSRRRTRAGSFSCGWRSSSARSRAARASRGRGTASAARLFDYAIWGLVLALLLSELRGAGRRAGRCWRSGSSHPLARADARSPGTWIPIEALLIAVAAARRRASGCSAATCSSRSPTRTRTARCDRSCCARCSASFRVWWEGIGCGFPLLAPILIAVAYETRRAEPGDRLGLRAGLPRHARARPACSTRSPASAASPRCCGSTASRGTSRWPTRSPRSARRSSRRCPSAQSLLPGGIGKRDLGHRWRDHAPRHRLRRRAVRSRRAEASIGAPGRF